MGEKRYNIQDVHEKTGINRSTVANLYHDRVSRIDYGTLAKLCELFDCDPGDMLASVKEES
jgi:putative transcriptional regulator